MSHTRHPSHSCVPKARPSQRRQCASQQAPLANGQGVSSVGPLTSGNSAFERTLPTQRQRSPSRRNGRPVFRESPLTLLRSPLRRWQSVLPPFAPVLRGASSEGTEGHENRCGGGESLTWREPTSSSSSKQARVVRSLSGTALILPLCVLSGELEGLVGSRH